MRAVASHFFSYEPYLLETNQDYHQKLLPLGDAYVTEHGEAFPSLIAAGFYALAYLFTRRDRGGS